MNGHVRIPIEIPHLRKTPLVSVLIANYNYEQYIGEAIESVKRQSYGNLEIVICDDGSSDDSCRVIQSYAKADPRITLIQKSNGGQASAINRAFFESQGDIICILDADDSFESSKITKIVGAFTRNPQNGLVIHDLLIIDGQGKKGGIAKYRQGGYLGDDIPTLKPGLPLPQASGLSFRRCVLEQILPIPEEKFRNVADWAIAYAAAYITNTNFVPEVLAYYRIHGGNLSGTTSTASRLDEEMVERILSGMTRVISFVDQFMQERYGIVVPASQIRNILEHRLVLGLLKKDRRLIDSSAADLCIAYKKVRRGYPLLRYLFWQSLSRLPSSLSRFFLLLAFSGFRLHRILRGFF